MSPIFRVNNGAFRLGSGKLTVSAGPLTLPFQADLRHWYDFTDITTLWQDTGLSTQITANGQEIKGITDKGTNSLDLIEEDTPRVFDNTTYAWSTSPGPTGVLGNPLGGAYSFAPPQTFFLVYTNIGTSAGGPFAVGGSGGFQAQIDGNFKPELRYNNVGGLFTIPDDVNEWYAAIYAAAPGDTQRMVHSNAGDKPGGTIADRTITDQAPSHGFMYVGAFNGGGTSPHVGHIAECGAWDIGEADEATLIDDFIAYTTDKYGIVWS